MIKVFLVLTLIVNALNAANISEDGVKTLQDDFIGSFQLCLNYNAEYEKINKIALRNLKFKDISGELGEIMLALESKESKSFLINTYKEDNDRLVLTTQNPNN